MANSIMLNLHVIASLRMDDKLFTSSHEFSVCAPGAFGSIMRKYYGETRIKNLNDIQGCINGAFAYISENESASGGRMQEAVEKSLSGLKCMQETYVDDARCSGQLSLIMNSIHDFLARAKRRRERRGEDEWDENRHGTADTASLTHTEEQW